MRTLYRGENEAMFTGRDGKLVQRLQGPLESSLDRSGRSVEIPTDTGTVARSIPWNRSGVGPGSGATRAPSITNTVLEHEAFQRPTTGVSSTPSLDRARFYAKRGGGPGRVFVIDRDRLKQYDVTEVIVASIVPFPRIPEDAEVLLVYEAGNVLPQEIVIEVLSV
jgi:hypothetical protein